MPGPKDELASSEIGIHIIGYTYHNVSYPSVCVRLAFLFHYLVAIIIARLISICMRLPRSHLLIRSQFASCIWPDCIPCPHIAYCISHCIFYFPSRIPIPIPLAISHLLCRTQLVYLVSSCRNHRQIPMRLGSIPFVANSCKLHLHLRIRANRISHIALPFTFPFRFPYYIFHLSCCTQV